MTIIRQPSGLADWRQATAMQYDYLEWLRGATGLDPLAEQPEFGLELSDLAAWYSRPDRILLMAFDAGVAVGIGAVRLHDDRTAELKRMFVRPIARGSGVSDELVRRLIGHARDECCDSMWLETLPGVMDPAIDLYGRHGFSIDSQSGRTLDVPDIVTMVRTLGRPCGRGVLLAV